MDTVKLWKPIALGKLGEFLKRIDKETSKEAILSAVDNLNIPQKCKENILHQFVSRGIITTPAPAGWMHFDPEKAIAFAMEEIRNCKEEA